jgi:hypothetical protein
LIKYGADIKWVDDAGWSYLHHAVSYSNLEVVRFILQHTDGTAAFYSQLTSSPYFLVLNPLGLPIDRRASITPSEQSCSDDSKPLIGRYLDARNVKQQQCQRQINSILESLLRAKVSTNSLDPSSGLSVLQLSLFHGFWGAARAMIEAHESLQNVNGCSVLCYAARARQPKLLRQLTKVYPLNSTTELGWQSAIDVAARLGNTPALQVLCSCIRKAAVVVEGVNGLTDNTCFYDQSLLYAVRRATVGVVQELMGMKESHHLVTSFEFWINVSRGGSCHIVADLLSMPYSSARNLAKNTIDSFDSDQCIQVLHEAVTHGHEGMALFWLKNLNSKKVNLAKSGTQTHT